MKSMVVVAAVLGAGALAVAYEGIKQYIAYKESQPQVPSTVITNSTAPPTYVFSPAQSSAFTPSSNSTSNFNPQQAPASSTASSPASQPPTTTAYNPQLGVSPGENIQYYAQHPNAYNGNAGSGNGGSGNSGSGNSGITVTTSDNTGTSGVLSIYVPAGSPNLHFS